MPSLSPSVRKSITLIYNFAERESKSRYKRSVLGWFWSFLNPLVTVGVYWFVFGAVYRAVPPETSNGNAENFGLYLFTGLVIWTLFTGLVDGSMAWLSSVSDLRRRFISQLRQLCWAVPPQTLCRPRSKSWCCFSSWQRSPISVGRSCSCRLPWRSPWDSVWGSDSSPRCSTPVTVTSSIWLVFCSTLRFFRYRSFTHPNSSNAKTSRRSLDSS